MNDNIHLENTVNSNNVSFIFLCLVVFLLPVVIVPWFGLSVDTVKNFSFIFFTIILSILSLIFGLRNNRNTYVPGGQLFLVWMLISGAIITSTLLSLVPMISLTGLGYELGTTTILISFLVLLLISSIILQKRGRVLILNILIITSSFFVFLFELIHIFGGHSLLTGTETLIGSSFNLAIFSGFIVILTLMVVTNHLFGKVFRLFSSFVLILALTILALFSFKLVWVVVAIFTCAIILLHRFTTLRLSKNGFTEGLSKVAIAVLMTSIFFISFTGAVVNIIPASLNTFALVDARPTWTQTYTVLKNTLIEGPKHSLLGSGPNTFSYQWNKHKSSSVNEGLLWKVTPEQGSGFLPTLIVTTGLLGTFMLVIFIYLLFSNGVRTLFAQIRNNKDSYLLVSTMLCALYGWLWALFYPINIVVLMLIAVINGGLLAQLIQRGKVSAFSLEKVMLYKKTVMFFVIIIVVVGVWALYVVGEKLASVVQYEKGLNSAGMADQVENAEAYLVKALEYSNQASFFRTLSEIEQKQMRVLLSQKKDISTKKLRKDFEELEFKSRENARKATQLDSENYLNWVVFGNHYFNLTFFAVPGVYTEGDKNYEIAAKLNPSNPTIPFLRARLALSQGDVQHAVTFLEKAVALKSDYTEAYTLLSQLKE